MNTENSYNEISISHTNKFLKIEERARSNWRLQLLYFSHTHFIKEYIGTIVFILTLFVVGFVFQYLLTSSEPLKVASLFFYALGLVCTLTAIAGHLYARAIPRGYFELKVRQQLYRKEYGVAFTNLSCNSQENFDRIEKMLDDFNKTYFNKKEVMDMLLPDDNISIQNLQDYFVEQVNTKSLTPRVCKDIVAKMTIAINYAYEH